MASAYLPICLSAYLPSIVFGEKHVSIVALRVDVCFDRGRFGSARFPIT